MTGQMPGDVTDAAIDAFTVACAKASSVPGATAGDCYRAGLTAALPGLTEPITTQERERIVTELRNRAASERDEAFTARSNHAADRHIHAGAALDAAADDLLGGTADGGHTPGGAT